MQAEDHMEKDETRWVERGMFWRTIPPLIIKPIMSRLQTYDG